MLPMYKPVSGRRDTDEKTVGQIRMGGRGMNKNRDTWWGQDATRILDYIEMYRGHMSDFEVLEDIMCGSYVDEFADHSECDPKVCEHACTRLEKEEQA